jgi:hypothetical protein
VTTTRSRRTFTRSSRPTSTRKSYTPFDHPDGRDINQRCLFLDGTPHHIERYRTTGWRHIDETGGSAMLPDGTMVLVQSSGASDETDQPKGTG